MRREQAVWRRRRRRGRSRARRQRPIARWSRSRRRRVFHQAASPGRPHAAPRPRACSWPRRPAQPLAPCRCPPAATAGCRAGGPLPPPCRRGSPGTSPPRVAAPAIRRGFRVPATWHRLLSRRHSRGCRPSRERGLNNDVAAWRRCSWCTDGVRGRQSEGEANSPRAKPTAGGRLDAVTTYSIRLEGRVHATVPERLASSGGGDTRVKTAQQAAFSPVRQSAGRMARASRLEPPPFRRHEDADDPAVGASF